MPRLFLATQNGQQVLNAQVSVSMVAMQEWVAEACKYNTLQLRKKVGEFLILSATAPGDKGGCLVAIDAQKNTPGVIDAFVAEIGDASKKGGAYYKLPTGAFYKESIGLQTSTGKELMIEWLDEYKEKRQEAISSLWLPTRKLCEWGRKYNAIQPEESLAVVLDQDEDPEAASHFIILRNEDGNHFVMVNNEEPFPSTNFSVWLQKIKELYGVPDDAQMSENSAKLPTWLKELEDSKLFVVVKNSKKGIVGWLSEPSDNNIKYLVGVGNETSPGFFSFVTEEVKNGKSASYIKLPKCQFYRVDTQGQGSIVNGKYALPSKDIYALLDGIKQKYSEEG